MGCPPSSSSVFLVSSSHLLCQTRHVYINQGFRLKILQNPVEDMRTILSQAVSYALFGCVTKAIEVGGNDQQPMVEDDVISSA